MFQGRDPISYLREHPIICLLLLSPGIPEYLSGSSPINAVVLNPFRFLFQVLANLGLYGPGVILIRESLVRWKRGWASVLVMGAAYGILEEGVALSTLYNPLANPVGKLGSYGHFAGVNWIWAAAILPVHMIFSISIPILLLGLALPETNGKSLVASRTRVFALFGMLPVDVLILFLFVNRGEHFWMGWPVFIGSFVAIGVLVLAARKVPANFSLARSESPRASPILIGIIGALYYTSVVITDGVSESRFPAAIGLALNVGVQALFLFVVISLVGRNNNSRHLVSLAAGLVVPIATIGLVSQARLPLVAVAVIAFYYFIWRLYRKYGGRLSSPPDLLIDHGRSG